MSVQLSSESIKSEPNVTPMIDVMLVLLIIFMIIIPALMAGFNAVPPSGQNLKVHPNEDDDIVFGGAARERLENGPGFLRPVQREVGNSERKAGRVAVRSVQKRALEDLHSFGEVPVLQMLDCAQQRDFLLR